MTRSRLIAALLFLGVATLATSAHAQRAFFSGTVTLSQYTLFVIDTEDNSLVDTVQPSSELSGYSASVFGPLPDVIFLAPTTRRRIEMVSTEPPFLRFFYQLSTVPRELDVTPDGQKAYVSTADGLDVIDLATTEFDTIFRVGPFRSADGVTITPDGGEVWVTVTGNGISLPGIGVIDTATDTVLERIPFNQGELPLQVTFSADGAKAYVSDLSRGVVVIDTATREITNEITFDTAGVARLSSLAPDGTALYVSTSEGVAVIDTASETVIAESVVGLFPGAIDVHPDGSRVYMLDLNGDLHVLDAITLELLEVISTPAANLFLSNEFIAPLP